MSESEQKAVWERQVLEKLVLSTLNEQRKTRNWGIFFKFIGFGYLFLTLALVLGWNRDSDEAGAAKKGEFHTAVVELSGVIGPGSEARAEKVNEGLRAAFADKKTKAVVLRINSPGGSPVQAGQINDEIRRLRAKHPQIPLYAVVEDICASGGYYVAAAADRIYVDKASLIGSIGVLMDGFGFTGTMEKLGVERRLLTAGENKGFLDPFSPVNPQQIDYAKNMLGEIHKQFIEVVRAGRGKRLKETPDMFSGLIWSGEKGIAMGLADAVGSVDTVARDVVKAEDVVDFTPKDRWTDRFAKTIGATFAQQLGMQAELKLK